MNQLEQDYYLRVRPVVGQDLATKRLAVWGLDLGYLAAEALARTGLRRQSWLAAGERAGQAFARSLGQEHLDTPIGPALAKHCKAHNHLESDWILDADLPRTTAQLARLLREDPAPDLLLASADAEAGEVARAAVEAGVPLVLTHVPRSAAAGVVQVVWTPESSADPGDLIKICAALGAAPALDLERPEHHWDGLEARSNALALASWVLLRHRRPRNDLAEPILRQGRAVVLRGGPDWPWNVNFIRTGPEDRSWLMDRLNRQIPRYTPPLGLLRDQRILVLGLGTASLFCAEAGLLASTLVFVDCKEVTPVNPVRQIYTTRHVGQPKAAALCEILSRRLEPEPSRWSAQSEEDLELLTSSRWTLGAAQLRIRANNTASEQRLGRLLDRVKPTLAVVGMGRTRNDNFAVTEQLRRRGIQHITPSAFPGVTHFKHILTDGPTGPCYDCIQGHLALDSGPGPTLEVEEREMFYGGSQPATLSETYPSAHSLLRLATGLALPRGARPAWLLKELAAERPCFVGANRAERHQTGAWLYGADRPFSMVTYGVEDLIPPEMDERCSCGRVIRSAP